MKKLHRVGVTCGVLSAALVFGVRAGDLEVPIQGLSITEKPAADYEKLIVHGPLSVSGTGVVVKTSVSASIGPDAGDDASVTVSGGAYMASSSNITYGGNGGKGGKITVSGDPMAWGWSGRDSGTFGGNVTHTISEYLTSDTGIFDLVEMGEKGYFGIKQVYNKNTRVKARLLFNGGYIWNKPAAATLFNADESAEIILEGVDARDILIYSPYANKTFFAGKGKLTVKGLGVLKYEISNSPEKSTTSFGGDINWENDGGFNILGQNHTVKLTSHDVLPSKAGTAVTVSSGKGWYTGDVAAYDKTYLCNILDLNGTTQKVCQLTIGTYAYVTNTSSKRAVLEIGECATNSISLNGSFGGAIDIILKSKRHAITLGTNFAPGDQVRVYQGDLELRNQKITGGTIQGTVVVSNWNQNVSPDPNYIKKGAVRDIAPSTVREMTLEAGSSVDVQAGALDVAKFAASAESSVRVHSNAAFRVRSQAGLEYKFIRFVFKEAIGLSTYGGKLYPNLKAICLVKENGADYWPGPGYNNFTYKTCDTALGDMPAGSYKFHSDKYADGKGPDLDTVNVPTGWPESSQRSSDYTFSRDSFLKNGNWGGIMFTNSVPQRADAASWHVVTLRLKDDGTKFSGYRFVSNWDNCSYPGCWAVEASDDGAIWATLDEKVDYYPFSYHQANGQVDGYNPWNSAPVPDKAVFPFFWTTNIAPGSVSFALNGAKLRVDKGGVLDVSQTGAAAEVSRLEVDAQLGGGRISSFKPALNGVLNVVNVATPGRLSAKERKLAFVFDEIVNPENLSSWKVCVDGVELENIQLKFTDTGLQVYGWGMTLLIR